MNKLWAYRDFVKHTAPSGYKKEINRTCLAMLIWLAVAIFAAPYLGIEINPLDQIPLAVLICLIYLTYLPLFSLLLAILGALSVLVSFINTQDFSGYGPLILGLNCFFTTRKLHDAFRSHQTDGTFTLDKTPGVIIGASQPIGEEAFTARSGCPFCGGRELRVIGMKYGRFTLRYSSHSADWRTFCPQCGRDVPIKSAQAKKLALESGQFVRYRRAEFVNRWLAAFAIFLSLMAVSIFVTIFLVRSDTVVYAGEVSSPELGADKQFIGEEMRIIDCFAVDAEDSWSWDWSDTEPVYALYMIATFETEDGSYLLPVKVLPDKDIFAACAAFAVDPSAELIPTNIHGYVDRLPYNLAKMFSETAQGWIDAAPGLVPINAMVVYWNGETAPSSDDDAVFVFQMMAVAGGLLSALFFWLDRYANSDICAQRVQSRYDRRKNMRPGLSLR